MTTNPFANDPTIASEYSDGRWRAKGSTLTTRDVADIHERLASHVERIRGRRGLSDQAKRVYIARAYVEARDAITGMKQAEKERITSERTKLHRKLFGHEGAADPTTAVSRRDAADRAAKLTKPEEAHRALQRAERGGDTHLAQAIAAHAADHVWTDVLQAYTASRPEAAGTVQALQELPDTTDALWRMQQAITYSVTQPTELGGMPDYSVNALAATELDVE